MSDDTLSSDDASATALDRALNAINEANIATAAAQRVIDSASGSAYDAATKAVEQVVGGIDTLKKAADLASSASDRIAAQTKIATDAATNASAANDKASQAVTAANAAVDKAKVAADAAAAVASTGRLTVDTFAKLATNLAYAEGASAEVVGDTAALNGLYLKSGASGSGAWVRKSGDTLPTVAADTRATAAAILSKLGVSGFAIEDAPDVAIGGVVYPVVVAYADGGICAAITAKGQFVPLLDDSGSIKTDVRASAESFGGSKYAVALADAAGAVIAGVTGDGRLVSEYPVEWPGIPFEAGADPAWLLAFAYTDDKIAFGIRADGSIYLPSANDGGANASGGLPGLSHIVGLGQSNEQGAQATPVVSGADVGFGSYKFARGLQSWLSSDHPAEPASRADAGFGFVPLVSVNSAATVEQVYMGETPAIGITSQMKTALSGGRFSPANLSTTAPHYLFTYPHTGGKHLAELDWRDYETNPADPNRGPGGYHATFVDDVKRAKASAAAAGYSYGVTAFHFTQGENEGAGYLLPGGPVLSYADFVPRYKADLAAAYARWDRDARQVSGQTRPVPLFITQVNNYWAGLSQVRLAQENANVFLVGPNYYVPSALNSVWNISQRGDPIHMSADGQRWRGEQAGKVMRRVFFEGEDWKPLQPRRVRRTSDTTIVLDFDVPRPPLAFETAWLPTAPGFGFTVALGTMDSPGGARTISSVAITGDRQVTITLDPATPVASGAAAFVTYGSAMTVGDTGAVSLSAVQAGADYTVGGGAVASTELVFPGDITAKFSTLLGEGCFGMRSYAGSGAFMVVRDVRTSGGNTILRGEKRSVVGTFTTGYPVAIERDRPFGNLRDSDPALSIFSFADASYGTRQGQAYPLRNFCVVFSAIVGA